MIEVDHCTGEAVNPVKTPVGWVRVLYEMRGSPPEGWSWRFRMPVSEAEYGQSGYDSRDDAVSACLTFVKGMNAAVDALKSVGQLK